jgi:excisionase family DNA binding protein
MKILNTKSPEETFLTSKQLTERWQCADITLQRWVAAGKLPVVMIGRNFRFRLSDILELERRSTK